MRKLITLLSLLALTSQGWAGDRDKRLLQAVSMEDVVGVRDLVQDPGFERQGRGWAASAGTGAASSAAKGTGSYGYSWVSTGGAGRTLTSAAVTIPAGLYGKNAVVSCAIKCVSGTCTHTLEAYDGTNPVSAQTTITSSSSTFARTSVNFVMPSSGTIAARLTTVSATEGDIYVDDCRISPADEYNISQVSQATFFGSLTYAATSGCNWTNTTASTTAPGAFSADSDCPTPTVTGYVAAPSTKIPAFVIPANSPTATYLILVNSRISGARTGTAGALRLLTSLHDGTSNYGLGTSQVESNTGGSMTSTDGIRDMTVVYPYTSSSSDKTIEIRASCHAATCSNQIAAADHALVFSVFKFPSSSETLYRPEIANVFGYAKSAATANCEWIASNASQQNYSADSDCPTPSVGGSMAAPATKVPGGTVASIPAGRYLAYAVGTFTATFSGTSSTCYFRISDGTNATTPVRATASASGEIGTVDAVSGIFDYSSNQTNVTFQVQSHLVAGSGSCRVASSTNEGFEIMLIPLTQVVPMPVLVGSVTSNSTGAERLERAEIDCDGGASITSQSGSWVSSVGNISSGACALTLATGTFSATPTCTCTTDNSDEICAIEPATSSTSITVKAKNNAGTASAGWIAYLHCMGPR